MRFKAHTARQKEVILETEGDRIFLDGKPVEADLSVISPGTYHIIRNHRSLNVQILEADLANKRFTVKVNEETFHLSLHDEFDDLLERMGMRSHEEEGAEDIHAPMPGLVLEVSAHEGKEVKKDEPLLVLEAMKMENVIRSTGDGTVKTIHVKKGDTVDKNQLLIEME